VKQITISGLETMPEIEAGADLPRIIIDCAEKESLGIKEKDILVITSKIISKAMGLTRKLAGVKPKQKALDLSRKTGKDAKLLQLIFDLGHEIIAMIPLEGMIKDTIVSSAYDREACEQLCQREKVMCITRDKKGRIYTHDSGIDTSNHPQCVVSLPPPEPDEAAEAIREDILAKTAQNIAVIIADTEIILFGTMDLALGSSGISPRSKLFGKTDAFGKPKFGGMDLTANELTAASALVFGQVDSKIPAAIIRGFDFELNTTENIANTIIPQVTNEQVKQTIKNIISATACALKPKQQRILKAISWFI
jgi:coenzyme F420-0:L-glutamate ligase/coenzyme F420-1:gamma-L-glutamate ligase